MEKVKLTKMTTENMINKYYDWYTGLITEKEYNRFLDEYLNFNGQKQQTKKENEMTKKNVVKTTSKYGVKLTQKKADRIRVLFEQSDKWTLTKLAEKFGVSRRTVGRVLDNECWFDGAWL